MSDDVHPIGSSFESFLEGEGILETVDKAAVKEVVAWQVGQTKPSRELTETVPAKWRSC